MLLGAAQPQGNLPNIRGKRQCSQRMAKALCTNEKFRKQALERTWRNIDPAKLRVDVQAHPDDCNDARAQRFGCSGKAIRQALQKLNIT